MHTKHPGPVRTRGNDFNFSIMAAYELTLHRANRDALDEIVLEDEEDDQHGDERQRRAGHAQSNVH